MVNGEWWVFLREELNEKRSSSYETERFPARERQQKLESNPRKFFIDYYISYLFYVVNIHKNLFFGIFSFFNFSFFTSKGS